MKKVRIFLKSNFPTFYSTLRYAKKALSYRTNRAIFTKIYRNNFWGDPESRSGPGSNLGETKIILRQLSILIEDLGVKSFLDAPCGDFNWMKEVNLDIEEYIGGDIVKWLIKDNRRKYASQNKKFILLDITKDKIPTVDFVFCRDCLVHFSFEDICSTVQNFKESNSTYLLTTTFTRVDKNTNICTGKWRPLNLQLPPFNFPEPIKLINENCTELNGRYADKSLGLWKISDIP